MYAKLFSSNEQTSLTKREQQIHSCIVQGLSTKEIAGKLYLSMHTVFTHRRNILRKNRLAQKVRMSFTQGLI